MGLCRWRSTWRQSGSAEMKEEGPVLRPAEQGKKNNPFVSLSRFYAGVRTPPCRRYRMVRAKTPALPEAGVARSRNPELVYSSVVEVDPQAGRVGDAQESILGAQFLLGDLLAQRGFLFGDE